MSVVLQRARVRVKTCKEIACQARVPTKWVSKAFVADLLAELERLDADLREAERDSWAEVNA